MKKVMTAVAVMAVVGLFATAPQKAQARPNYAKVFTEKYENLKEKYDEKKCGTCHAKDKKVRSDYAKAFGKALGAAKVTDIDKIKAAFDEAAKAKNGEEGTYGDLLKKGELPPPAKEAAAE